jgi:hypothetical protein
MDDLSAILAFPNSYHLERVIPGNDLLTMVMHSQTQAACCPACHCLSDSVHGHYWRYLPLSQSPVQIQLRVVRFRCGNPTCTRQTFVEDLAPYGRRYSRRTQRATHLLAHLAFEFGAECRGAQRYHLVTRRSTLIRLVRHSVTSA